MRTKTVSSAKEGVIAAVLQPLDSAELRQVQGGVMVADDLIMIGAFLLVTGAFYWAVQRQAGGPTSPPPPPPPPKTLPEFQWKP